MRPAHAAPTRPLRRDCGCARVTHSLHGCTHVHAGIGKVKNRDNATLWGTDQEHKLRCPDDPFFKKFAAEASRVQIAVDVFVLGCGFEP